MLKKYIELGSSNRGEPCQEYPGRWIVISGDKESLFQTYHEAFVSAAVDWETSEISETEIDVSICWQASNNDPRIGQVWFTGFYRHGYFDIFGNYKS